MPDYEKLYHILFNAATDALNCLEKMNIGQAKSALVGAQRDAEEEYLRSEEREKNRA